MIAKVGFGVALLMAAPCCQRRHAEAIDPGPFREPIIGIGIEPRADTIVFAFSICGSSAGEAFVDRLLIERVSPKSDAGTMCRYESPNDSSGLTKPWRYGESVSGFDRCWPLTEGTYDVTAIGSGAGSARFSLKEKWFGSGFTRTILRESCAD
jgi:hypothetical protein